MTRCGHAARALIPLLLGLSSAGWARAQTPETVWLELPECSTPPYDRGELLGSLEIELAPYHLQARVTPADSAQPGLTVRVGLPRCDADASSLTLQYADAQGRHSRKRALSLRDVPKPARARMLALVIAYALRPSRETEDAELAPGTADPLQAEPFSDLPVREFPFPPSLHEQALWYDELAYRSAPELPGPLRHTLQLGAGAVWHWLTFHGDLLVGMELNLRGRLLGRSEWTLEGSEAGGTTWLTDSDSLHVQWWKGALGVDYPLTTSPCARIGPRLALARLDGGVNAVALISAGGRASFSAHVGSRANLNVQFEADHSLRVEPLTTDGVFLPWYGWAFTWGAGLTFDL